VGLTKFEVSNSRNISKLKALKNNIIATQKKLFSKHEDSILNHLLVHPNRLDFVLYSSTNTLPYLWIAVVSSPVQSE